MEPKSSHVWQLRNLTHEEWVSHVKAAIQAKIDADPTYKSKLDEHMKTISRLRRPKRLMASEDTMRSYLDQKLSITQMAEKIGCSKVTIYRLLHRYNIVLVSTRVYPSNPTIITKCKNCGAPIKRRTHDKGKTQESAYCNHICQQETQYKEYIARWLKGSETGLRGLSISDYIRKYLFEKNNHKCQKCGWSETNPTTRKIPLEVNHINGNWRDNRPENLELLCPNCHSLTSTFGSLNKGHGRRRN